MDEIADGVEAERREGSSAGVREPKRTARSQCLCEDVGVSVGHERRKSTMRGARLDARGDGNMLCCPRTRDRVVLYDLAREIYEASTI
jgi:hypothetical protein